MEIVSKQFEPLINHAQAKLYLLTNNDFLLITANPVLEVIDAILYQVRSLFSDDFFISSRNLEDFQQIFFLPKDTEALLKVLFPEKQPVKKERKLSHLLPIKPTAQELTPDILESILYQIEKTSTKEFIRRQTIISLAKDRNGSEFGQEFYTSLMELQNLLAPNLNLTSDKALFLMLTDMLDKRMMSVLPELKLRRYPPLISLNLNVQSVFLPIFDKILTSAPAKVMIEFQISDIMHNLPLFRKACEKLRHASVDCALDGIGINEMEYLPISAFDVDCYKIFWSPKWAETNVLESFVQKNKNKNIILSRCENEEAFAYGQKIGITLFQGYFIDTLLAAVCKNACTFGQECSLGDCRNRHGVIYGALRNACVHEPHLDAYIPLKGAGK